jgi:hypothetical protein
MGDPIGFIFFKESWDKNKATEWLQTAGIKYLSIEDEGVHVWAELRDTNPYCDDFYEYDLAPDLMLIMAHKLGKNCPKKWRLCDIDGSAKRGVQQPLLDGAKSEEVAERA